MAASAGMLRSLIGCTEQIAVYLTAEQHSKLVKLKEKTGAPVSEIIRRAIDRYLKAERRK
jgi:predicted DNA-binding protein